MKGSNYILLLFIISIIYVLFKLVSYNLKKRKPIVQNDTSLNDSTIENAIDTKYTFIEDNFHSNDFKVEKAVESEKTFIENEVYFYKVTEELVGFDDIYPPVTLFNKGNLLRNKFNASDWFNRRKEKLALKQQLFGSEHSSYRLRLFLIKKDSNCELEYLLIDETGLRNDENTLFEGRLLESLGFNKQSDPYQDNNPIISRNSYLHSNSRII